MEMELKAWPNGLLIFGFARAGNRIIVYDILFEKIIQFQF